MSVRLGRFSVKNVTPTKDGESSKIKVKIRMDIHGIFYVSKAQMIEKVPSDDESVSEPMETQPAAEAGNNDNNIADAQNEVKDGAQVQCFCKWLLIIADNYFRLNHLLCVRSGNITLFKYHFRLFMINWCIFPHHFCFGYYT